MNGIPLAERIYRLFQFLFGDNLADYLSGFVCVDCNNGQYIGDYTGTNQYGLIFLITVLTVIAGCCVYYFAMDRPKFAKKWKWLIFLLIIAFICGIIGFCFPYADLRNGDISDWLRYFYDVNCQPTGKAITTISCVEFGFVNFIISGVLFWISSNLFKYFPIVSSLKHTPHKQLFRKREKTNK